MPWGATFRGELLKSTLSPQFSIASIRPPYPIASGGWIVTGDHLGQLYPFVGTSVNTFTWAAQPGTFGFSIVGDTHLFRQNMWPGQLCEIRCGFPGMDPATWEPIAVGAIWQVSGTIQELRVECLDLLGAMRSRYTAVAEEQALFFDVGGEVTTDMTASFNFGTATTISVTSTTGFPSSGLIQLDHPNLTNGPFFVSYTGTTSTTFTGVSTTAKLGTTGQVMPSGTVTSAAVITDHPIDIARQVLASTGAATNGTFDVLPESHGYAFADRHLDHIDSDKFRAFCTPSSGSGDWSVPVTEPQDNGYNWLQSWLQLGGYFLTMRQGRITVRGAQHLTVGTSTVAAVNGIHQPSNITITDDDLDHGSYPQWDAWDSNHVVEYATYRVKTATNRSEVTETVTGLPAANRYLENLKDYVFDNETNQRSLQLHRLKQWRCRRPERLTIQWANPRLMQLAAGDPVRLNLNRVAGRLNTSSAGYRDHWGMVIQNNPDWMRMRGTMTIAVPPDKADEFGG